MGAHSFGLVFRGENNVREAYRRAVEDALHEYGHDPYNGSISTTNGFVQVERHPVSETRAYEIENEWHNAHHDDPRFRGIGKWDACGAVPLLKNVKTDEVTRTKKVILDAVEFAAYIADGGEHGSFLKGHIKPLKGYELSRVLVKESDLSTKVVTQATDGDRETRYIVEGSNRHATWETGFPTQAKARAFIDEAAKAEEISAWGAHQANKAYGIYAITRRADGSPLVRTKRTVKKAVLTVEYVMHKTPDTNEHDGFYFFGMAAS